MKLLYAVIDTIANDLVGSIFMQRADAPAIRIFGDIASDPQSIISKHPHDFELVCLATLDDETHTLTPLITASGRPRIVISGTQWAAAQQPQLHKEA